MKIKAIMLKDGRIIQSSKTAPIKKEGLEYIQAFKIGKVFYTPVAVQYKEFPDDWERVN